MHNRMNKIFIIAALLLGTTGFFTACEDDRESNPILVPTQELHLNTPPYATQPIDLSRSRTLRLTWSQPPVTDLGAPLTGMAFYSVQISKDGQFTTSTTQAAADETGKTIANYVVLNETYPACQADLNMASVAKAVQQLFLWEEGKVPATQELFVRIVANFTGHNSTAAPGQIVASNVLKLTTIPSYVELRDAAPVLWYMIGNTIADGNWKNSPDQLGVSHFPLFPIDGYEYDKVTGVGKIAYTGYFKQGGDGSFKILPASRAWEHAFIWVDGKIVYRNGGDDGGNIEVPQSGYYTITINTEKNTCTVEEAKDITAPTLYTKMELLGANGEEAIVMSPVNQKVENHLWVADVQLNGKATLTFRAEGAKIFGRAAFPFGKATQDGKGIPALKGNYKVFFDDLTGHYNFILK